MVISLQAPSILTGRSNWLVSIPRASPRLDRLRTAPLDQDNPGLMVSRLLQVAMSEPNGPVFLSIPRESAMLPYPGTGRFPTRDQLGVSQGVFPDPEHAKTIAKWLVKARLGRDAQRRAGGGGG